MLLLVSSVSGRSHLRSAAGQTLVVPRTGTVLRQNNSMCADQWHGTVSRQKLRCPSLTIRVFRRRLKSFLIYSCVHWEFLLGPCVMTGVRQRRRCHRCTNWGSRISRERFDLESPKFTWTFTPVGSTTTLDMTSKRTSGRKLLTFEKWLKMTPPTASA